MKSTRNIIIFLVILMRSHGSVHITLNIVTQGLTALGYDVGCTK